MTILPGAPQVPVLLTGARGRIASMVRPLLVAAGWDLTCLDRDAGDDPDVQAVDILDGQALDAATAGCRAVVHLAGISGEAPLPEVLRVNVHGTQAVLDAALRRGIQRVVLASSNHAVGFWERSGDHRLGVDIRARPDSFYGVGKVAAEALVSDSPWNPIAPAVAARRPGRSRVATVRRHEARSGPR